MFNFTLSLNFDQNSRIHLRMITCLKRRSCFSVSFMSGLVRIKVGETTPPVSEVGADLICESWFTIYKYVPTNFIISNVFWLSHVLAENDILILFLINYHLSCLSVKPNIQPDVIYTY